jgi:hypothetical protein
MLAREVYHCTVQIIDLPAKAPTFILRREEFVDRFIDRVRVFGSMGDIDFKENPDFSKQYFLKGSNESEIRAYFKPEILEFFEEHPAYHIECNGKQLLIVSPVGVTTVPEVEAQIKTMEKLIAILKEFHGNS